MLFTLILGPPETGKTTFSRRFNCTVIHLDHVQDFAGHSDLPRAAAQQVYREKGPVVVEGTQGYRVLRFILRNGFPAPTMVLKFGKRTLHPSKHCALIRGLDTIWKECEKLWPDLPKHVIEIVPFEPTPGTSSEPESPDKTAYPSSLHSELGNSALRAGTDPGEVPLPERKNL